MMKMLLSIKGITLLVRFSWMIMLGLLLTACTGRGGGWLPPNSTSTPGFSGQATFGFSFSCQDASALTGPTGRLKIELDYSDKGTNPLEGPFSIHGNADTLDPVLESEICIGQNPPPLYPVEPLIFLGVYRPTSPPPPLFPPSCAKTISDTSTPQCRFEVQVRDNDQNGAPSAGDYFAIQLSTSTTLTSEFPAGSVFYARAGTLEGGNITVK
jgi:hypothetical protein